MNPSITQLAAPLKEAELPLAQLEQLQQEQNLPLDLYCNELSLHAAESYTRGIITAQAGETLTSNIHTLMAGAMEQGTIDNLPQPAFSIFQAFGSGNTSEELKQILAATNKEQPSADKEDSWYGLLGFGIVSLGGSYFLFQYFVDFENSTDQTRRMNAVIALLYELGGKWLACSVVAALGAFLIYCGIEKKITDSRKKKRLAELTE